MLREAWYRGSNSCNCCIELHPAYQALRYRLNNRGRPDRSQSGTRTRRGERTTAGNHRTPQDQRPTTAETEGLQGGTRTMASLHGTMEAEPPPLPPPLPTRMTMVTATTTATVTTDNRIIGLGDQTDDCTNRHVDTRTMRINRANQETADNLTNRRITLSMVRQGLAQL